VRDRVDHVQRAVAPVGCVGIGRPAARGLACARRGTLYTPMTSTPTKRAFKTKKSNHYPYNHRKPGNEKAEANASVFSLFLFAQK
jgi:hypothetical protein